MEIRINLVEVAAELAEKATIQQMHQQLVKSGLKIVDEHAVDLAVYEMDGDTTVYTEDAQEMFNNWYDYYFEFLESRKII